MEPSFSRATHFEMAHVWAEADERMARIAARRAFVEMKLCFMRAAADVAGPIGARLQQKVRQATEAVELWRLRAAILCSLPPDHERTPAHCLELERQLDSLFTDSSMPAHGALRHCSAPR